MVQKTNQKFLIGWKKPNGIYTEKLTLSEVFTRDNSDLKSCTPTFCLEFTGYFDLDNEELYDGDVLLGLDKGFVVEWNQNQCMWSLRPFGIIKAYLKEDDFFLIALGYCRLGNGYLKRRDLKREGNIFVNPELKTKYNID